MGDGSGAAILAAKAAGLTEPEKMADAGVKRLSSAVLRDGEGQRGAGVDGVRRVDAPGPRRNLS